MATNEKTNHSQIGPNYEIISFHPTCVVFDLTSAHYGCGVGDVQDLGSFAARQPEVFDQDVQTQVSLEAELLRLFKSNALVGLR